MKFIVDAQLPPALAVWLRERGHQADHVFEIAKVGATDLEIAAEAELKGAIVITKDEDFLPLALQNRFQFLWLRCGNASTRALLEWLDPRWPEIERLLSQGETVVEAR